VGESWDIGGKAGEERVKIIKDVKSDWKMQMKYVDFILKYLGIALGHIRELQAMKASVLTGQSREGRLNSIKNYFVAQVVVEMIVKIILLLRKSVQGEASKVEYLTKLATRLNKNLAEAENELMLIPSFAYDVVQMEAPVEHIVKEMVEKELAAL